jgi:hypothetical protein
MATKGTTQTYPTVAPYIQAAPATSITIQYAASTTYTQAASFESFFNSISSTTPNVDTCALDKCKIMEKGCVTPFQDSALDVTDYYLPSGAITSKSIIVDQTETST